MINHLPRGRTLLAAAALALGSIDVTADTEIYRCLDADGNITFQDDPCAAGTEAPAVPSPEQTSEPPPAPPAVKPVVRMVPAKAPRPAPVPVTAPRPSPETPKAVAASPPTLQVLPPLPEPIPAPPRPRRSFGPVDPRFASPERTWETFVSAMRNGDRETALNCLGETTREEFGASVETLSAEALRALAAEYERVEFEGEVGPFWSVRVLRANTRPTWIFLQRTEEGAWKIAAI
jgi:hypothetical protein